MSSQDTYPIYEGLIIGDGKVQDKPVPDHSLEGEDPVIQDKVFVNHSKKVFAIADGVTGSGQKSADVAEYVVNEFSKILYDSISTNKNKYGIIYRDLEYALGHIHSDMKNKFDASSTIIAGHITPDRKLVTYRVGDCESRLIRDGRIYHLDNIMTMIGDIKDASSLCYERIFAGTFLEPTFKQGTDVQSKNYDMPNQVGDASSHGRLTVHNLKYGDKIIFSSDGFNKAFYNRIEDKIRHIVNNAPNPEAAEDNLIKAAVNIGLLDDYSAIVIFNDSPSKKTIFWHRTEKFFEKWGL